MTLISDPLAVTRPGPFWPAERASRSESRCSETGGSKTCQEQSCVVAIFFGPGGRGEKWGGSSFPQGAVWVAGGFGGWRERAPPRRPKAGKLAARSAQSFSRRPARE